MTLRKKLDIGSRDTSLMTLVVNGPKKWLVASR